MKLYKRYLLANVFKNFLLVLFTLTSIIWITRVINYLDHVTEYGLSVKNFTIIILLLLPALLEITVPLGLFLSVIFVYDKLVKNNEIMILQGVGIKKIQLLQPVAYINIVVIFLSYLNVMFITPNANKRFDNMRDRMKNDIINLMFKNKNFNSVKNITFYANANERNALRDLMLYIKSMDGDDKDKIIYAKNAKINGVYAKMYHGNIQEFDMFDKTKNNIVFFEEYSLNLADYYDLDIKKGERVDEDCLNIKELLKMRKQENIKPIIIKRFVSPLISLFLSTLACVLVLNKPFSRMESEKEVVKIYFICIVCFSIFLYLVAKLEKAIVSYNLLLLYIASFFVADVVLIGKKNV